jgi:hypothetical protein
MRRLIIATAAVTALFAGAGAANAQRYYNDGYRYGHDYYQQRPLTNREVALPFGRAPDGYSPLYSTPDGTTENSRAFQSQELLPQSPPGGS